MRFLWIIVLLGLPSGARADRPRRIHVFVALADNVNQGIVPVPTKLGNGDDPRNNLYWGAAYGVKTFFDRHAAWVAVPSSGPLPPNVLERVVFEHRETKALLTADAYRGVAIKNAIEDFLAAAAGADIELAAYVGHDGLMDFSLDKMPERTDAKTRDAIILACVSKSYFDGPLAFTGARPLLWTTGLMAPEAYTLAAALDGWLAQESATQIRDRAAEAYHRYQKCGVKAARRLLTTGR